MRRELATQRKEPDLVLCDGPGDPEADPARIHQLRSLLGRLPIMGLGLGHLLLAVSAGGRTGRMKHGHRGGNQPVKDVQGTRTYITGQNHGHSVLAESVPGAVLRYVNLNDSSCEGLDYPALDAFSVQFMPEKGSVPQDTTFLYDRFISMMGGE